MIQTAHDCPMCGTELVAELSRDFGDDLENIKEDNHRHHVRTTFDCPNCPFDGTGTTTFLPNGGGVERSISA